MAESAITTESNPSPPVPQRIVAVACSPERALTANPLTSSSSHSLSVSGTSPPGPPPEEPSTGRSVMLASSIDATELGLAAAFSTVASATLPMA